MYITYRFFDNYFIKMYYPYVYPIWIPRFIIYFILLFYWNFIGDISYDAIYKLFKTYDILSENAIFVYSSFLDYMEQKKPGQLVHKIHPEVSALFPEWILASTFSAR